MRNFQCALAAVLVAVFSLTLPTPTGAQIPASGDAKKVLSKSYGGKSYSPYAGRGLELLSNDVA